MNLILLFLVFISSTLVTASRDYTNRDYYTLYTLHGQDAVKQVAHSLNARYEGQVGELSQYHLISVPKPLKRSSIDTVIAQFQYHKQLAKRDDYWVQVQDIQLQVPARRLYKRAPIEQPVVENTEEEYRLNGGGPSVELPLLSEEGGYNKIKELLGVFDPGFDQQWHLLNQENVGHDMNVTGVWSQGITGKNVVVAILDDGLDMDHPDLKDNYFAEGSYDFNNHVADPKPRLSDDTHGTRCAGEIAASKNDVCGVGIAYDAKVSGIRILSGEITEADEAAALNYAFQKNHIYSCSWGPPDLGEVAEAPQGILLDAIKHGIEKGRNGTGSIYVFASGNGGANDDNCNFDGYTNSIFTITVGAVDKLGNHPPYSEQCSAQLVVAYSSGSGGYIYTTDVAGQCSDRHGGTSAAAPLAAGVFALVLSIRPDLTWRDMQHLCVQSAIPISLDDPDWTTLPSGRMFNHKYGYGALDAYRIVELAKRFKSVREQTHLEIISENEKMDIPDSTPIVDKDKAFKTTLIVTDEMVTEVGLSRLEHVTATVNIEHQRRGDLEILLRSPSGIISQLGTSRKRDKSDAGFVNWTFMTVKHWEENPVGNWTLFVIDGKNKESTGKFVDWKLSLFGEVKEGVQVPKNSTVFNQTDSNQSFLEVDDEKDEEESSTSFIMYSFITVFMVASLASTAFIVKKYMLSTNNISYARPTEDDTYEFDNLLAEGETDDDEDNDDDNDDDDDDDEDDLMR
ncbi:peptidase S8/S53 domain-containing protein [Pilaira anomala]|nr:peptidase S8/S53 domain-containing protein [Pilaira anomala]